MKKLLVLLWAIVMIGYSSYAYDFSYTYDGKTLYYNYVDNNSVEVTGEVFGGYGVPSYTNLLGAVVIPDSVVDNNTTYRVGGIGNNAFYFCSGITSVIIPSSVVSIGNYAFYNCEFMTSIVIPDGVVSIGLYAFESCSALTSLNLPKTIKSIGDFAFGSCTSLGDTVFIPDSVTFISDGCFRNCSGLNAVVFNDIIISIGSTAFWGCSGLSDTLVIPSSVLTIGSYAFYNCFGLTCVILSEGITSIGNSAFSNCYALIGDLVLPASVTSLESSAFACCQNLNTVTMGNSVTVISSYVFSSCIGLTSVTLGDSVTVIDNFAFNGCTGLMSINIPNTVTTIGNKAFYNCTSMSSITIPDAVTSVGFSAFEECGLDSITVGCSLSNIGNDAFSGIYPTYLNYNCQVDLPGAIQSKSVLNTVIVGDSVQTIFDDAFENCTLLGTVIIGNSLTSIGRKAFLNCSSLDSINIPATVNTIGSCAFRGCTGLVDVNLLCAISTIHDSCFYGCVALPNVSIPDGVESIGGAAFRYCSNLTVVNLPPALDTIGMMAFEGCSSLPEINFPETVTTIDAMAFMDCTSLTSLVLHDGLASIGNNAFRNCNHIDTVFLLSSTAPSLGINVFSNNAEGRVFMLGGCWYENYQGAAGWTSYMDAIRVPDYGFSITLLSENDTMGSVSVVLAHNNEVRCDSTAVIQAVANPGYHFVQWSTGSTANPDTIHLFGDTTVTAFFIDDVYTSICMVTVENNHYKVVWNKETGVSDYLIYRMAEDENQFELAAVVPYNDLSTWTDVASDPVNNRCRYRISATDSYGNESPRSTVHRTMHLSLYRGDNQGQWVLYWLPYDGIDYNTYIIYRGTRIDNMQEIERVPIGGENVFIDNYTASGDVYYQVGILLPNPCNPSKSYDVALSNCVYSGNIGIGSVDSFPYDIAAVNGCVIVNGGDNEQVVVYDITGRVLTNTKLDKNPWRCEVPVSGVYVVKVGDYPAKKIVVIK